MFNILSGRMYITKINSSCCTLNCISYPPVSSISATTLTRPPGRPLGSVRTKKKSTNYRKPSQDGRNKPATDDSSTDVIHSRSPAVSDPRPKGQINDRSQSDDRSTRDNDECDVDSEDVPAKVGTFLL